MSIHRFQSAFECLTRASGRSVVLTIVFVLGAIGVPPSGKGEENTTELTGTVDLIESGQPVAAVANAVVYYEPASGARPAVPRSAEVTTQRKRFSPRVLPVSVGSVVRFPNQDPIFHNVFSVSPGNRFDLGRYQEGRGKSQKFMTPGLVRVYCNVHHSMAAYVLVLDTPYYTTSDAQGRFTLTGLPAGRGTLTVWHESAAPWKQEIERPTRAPLQIHMTVTVKGLPPHLNKFGKPYGTDDSGESYR